MRFYEIFNFDLIAFVMLKLGRGSAKLMRENLRRSIQV